LVPALRRGTGGDEMNPGINDLRTIAHEHEGLAIRVMRGLVDSQFLSDRYTLMVETQIGDRDTRKCFWEFGGGQPPRFMGYLSGAEASAMIADGLKAVAGRYSSD
jgi:hypothetical protein